MKIASLTGVVALMLPADPQFWIACTTGATVIGSIILQILKNRQDDKRHERDRREHLEHQEELKRGVLEVAYVAEVTRRDLKSDIADNTKLTAQVGAKADQAYEAANNVNEKIASMARPVAVAQAVAADTNKTVHRIEDKG